MEKTQTLKLKGRFKKKNTMKLDAIRDEIDNLGLEEIDKAIAITSLILALDSVDNTIGHFSSYLSRWSPRSFNDLVLRMPMLKPTLGKHEVLCGDIFESLKGRQFDLAYFDPPYGSNNKKMPSSRVRYAAYYHIWITVVKNDKPNLFGKVNRREDTRDAVAGSVFEEFRKNENGNFIAMEAIQNVIKQLTLGTSCSHIVPVVERQNKNY